MGKWGCACGFGMNDHLYPDPNSFRVFSDYTWDAIPYDDDGKVHVLDFPLQDYDVYKCPNCGRLMVFGSDDFYECYKIDVSDTPPEVFPHQMFDIVRWCSENDVIITKDFHENNSEEMVFDRLERAVGNIHDGGKLQPAAPARFAIWAADVIDLLEESAKAANNGDIARANELQTKAIKTIFAFKECMRLLDTDAHFKQFYTQEEILNRYK